MASREITVNVRGLDDVRSLIDDNRRLRIRAHDAELAVDGQRHLARQLLAEIDACHRMIARLWLRQLPNWSGDSWDEPDEAPEVEHDGHDNLPHLTWRETSHLIRALSEFGVVAPVGSSVFTPGGLRGLYEIEDDPLTGQSAMGQTREDDLQGMRDG